MPGPGVPSPELYVTPLHARQPKLVLTVIMHTMDFEPIKRFVKVRDMLVAT